MPERGGHDDDDFTFPTPPPQLLAVAARAYGHHNSSRSRVSPSSPVLLAPIRRSFSAADSAASTWGSSPRAAGSPALSYYAAGYSDLEDEDEEVMDSLWQDLNDDDDEALAAEGKKDVGDDLFRASLDVSRRCSLGFPSQPVERRRPTAATKDQRVAAAAELRASRSSRRRPAGLAVMMRALKKMLVAHKSRSKVHKVDEQSAAASSPPAASSSSGKKRF